MPDNLRNSIWYGSKSSKEEIEELKQLLLKISTEKDCILVINELLKVGDFSAKGLLIQLLNSSEEENVLNLGVRLFCSILTHEDLLETGNFEFLSNASEDTISTFASCAIDTMSYNVIPLLLVLLEDWEDTNIEVEIRNTLEIYLNYTKDIGENASVEEIGQLYNNLLKSIDDSLYYYFSEPSFPGALAKELIQASVASMNQSRPLGRDLIPTLLSIWSGVKCPVEYNTVINDEKFKQLLNYVEDLSEMDWKSGGKYFYGHLLNS
ncbi:hypothetical protein FQ087_19470 [Sporosarcina sp. ANT_H38]|uniref:Imm47 family immunity protein n=1 Tax=Sporosarcina sp. ANT_H38 TaxID=2597358 RepID=UPI0011F12D04|nr:Imm47 family immunity protein [Sporosarcina sp. ANT_H38]KAA0944291.1 hypothetical protein FQ087_19470 [Sporosarcina sp. ANT_H38]